MLLRRLLPVVRVPAQQTPSMLAAGPRAWGGTPSVRSPLVPSLLLPSSSGPASLWRSLTAAQHYSRHCSNLASHGAASVATAMLAVPLTTSPHDPAQQVAAPWSTLPAVQDPTLVDQAAAGSASPGLVPSGSRLLLLGIDPDGQGAIAALSCDILTQQPPAPSSSSSSGDVSTSSGTDSTGSDSIDASQPSASIPSQQRGPPAPLLQQVAPACGCAAGAAAAACAGPEALPCHLDLGGAQVALYDMPRVEVPLLTKGKGGKVRTRKRLDIDAVVALVQHLVAQHTCRHPTPAAGTTPLAANSSGAALNAPITPQTLATSRSRHSSDSSSSDGPLSSTSSSPGEGGGAGGLVLRAVLEVTGGILPINGMYSIQTSAYIQGAWLGVLRASGFEVCTVPPKPWKRDLGLLSSSKDASRALASSVFQEQAALLKRKRDHGRAEALLLAAWGGGLTAAGGSSNSSNDSGALDVGAIDATPASTTSSSSSSRGKVGLRAGPCRVHLMADAAGRVLPPLSSLAAASASLHEAGAGGRRQGAKETKTKRGAGPRRSKASGGNVGASSLRSNPTISSSDSGGDVDVSSSVKRRGRPQQVAAAPQLEPDSSSSSSSSSGGGDTSSSVKRRGRPRKPVL